MNELFKDHAKVFIRTPLYSYQSLFDDNNETKSLDDLILLRIQDSVFMEALYLDTTTAYRIHGLSFFQQIL